MLILGACRGDPETVLTEVTIALPPGDAAASDALERIDLQVLDEGDGACTSLATWLARRCDGDTADPPALWEQGVTELGRAESIELPASGDGPWEIAARALDGADAPFLYGCAVAVSGRATVVPLWRAWDDLDVCAGQVHPACPVYVDCDASAREFALGSPGRPVCQVAGSAADGGALSWEQGGVACPPPDGSYPLPCRPAVVSCLPGALEPVEDGTCPIARGVDVCGGSFADDLDCDGRIPECPDPGDCVAGLPCGDADCGTTVCNDDGTADCTRPREVCDGVDGDCDGVPDEQDRDALWACNARRPADAPRADRCSGGFCVCGQDRPCDDRHRCCADGTCQAIDSPCRVTDAAAPGR